MKTLFILALLLPAPAQAANPCTDPPPTTVVFSPSRVYATLPPEHTQTLADGSPAVTGYQAAYFDSAVTDLTTPPAAGPLTVPKTAWTLVVGTVDCYTANLPIPVPNAARPLVGVFKSVRAATATLPATESLWSPASNPFAKAPGVLTAPGRAVIR